MDKEKKIRETEPERRFYKLELRAVEDETGKTKYFEGYAASFNTESSVLFEYIDGEWREFVEIIEQGAFDEAIADPDADILLNVQHEDRDMIARFQPSDEIFNLELKPDDKGLFIRAEVPNTTVANDAYEHVNRGNIKRMSFAFWVSKTGERWSERPDGMLQRNITSFAKVFDVTLARRPAYNGHNATSINVAQRSGQTFDPAKTTPNEQTTSTTHPGYGYQYKLLKLKSQSI